MEKNLENFKKELDKFGVKNHIIDGGIKEKNGVFSVKIYKNLRDNNFIYIFYKNGRIKANVVNIDKKEIIYDIKYSLIKEIIHHVLEFYL